MNSSYFLTLHLLTQYTFSYIFHLYYIYIYVYTHMCISPINIFMIFIFQDLWWSPKNCMVKIARSLSKINSFFFFFSLRNRLSFYSGGKVNSFKVFQSILKVNVAMLKKKKKSCHMLKTACTVWEC